RSISKSYMRNSVGCLMVFDISQRKTFENVRSWHTEVVEYVKPATMVFTLVGHKSDLHELREVSEHEAEALARSLGMTGYIEVSSKNNMNVDLAFETLTKEIYNQFHLGQIPMHDGWYGLTVGTPLKFENTEEPKPKTSGCGCG
ncbi:RB39B protein, partial [Amia calva]|nr:RB39B protein [Amia calva]